MSELRHWSTERSELVKAYPGKKWYKKVLEMSDAQVHATYISVKNRLEKQQKAEKMCDKSACKSVTV